MDTGDPKIEPLVGVIIVHYNNVEDTQRCLASLEGLDYRNFFTVIVDNCSPNNSGAELRRRFEGDRLQFVLSPENRGFAAANNIGMGQARAYGAKYFWLLNPDTEVELSSLSALVAALGEADEVAACGSKILYGKTETEGVDESIWGAGGIVDFEKREVSMRGTQQKDHGQFDTPTSCDYLPGCSLLVRADIVERVGAMPERYFMYFEETDWCTRMKRAGFQLRYVPTSVVRHYFHDPKMQEPFGVYYYNRNELYFWQAFASRAQRYKISLEVLVKRLPQNVKALFAAPDAHHRSIFLAHVLSQIDFLLGKTGKRNSFSRSTHAIATVT